MKNVNVKVIMNNEGQVSVTGIKANGEASAVNYAVVETNAGDIKGLFEVKESLEKQLAAAPKQIQAKLKSSVTMSVLQSSVAGLYEAIHWVSEKEAYDKLPQLQEKVTMIATYLKEMGIWNENHQTDAELNMTKALHVAATRKSIKDKKKDAERSEAGQKQEQQSVKQDAAAKQKEEKDMNQKQIINRKGYDAVTTGGKMFTDIKGIKTGEVRRAVSFTTAKGQNVVIGFAKDKNMFMEAVNGVVKEASLSEVLKRLAKYEGKDAKYLTKMVKSVRPVTMAAGQCSSCGCDVSQRVKEYSERTYGVTLCRDCQKDFGAKIKKDSTPVKETAASASEPQQKEVQGHSVPGLSFEKDACECGNEKMVEMSCCDECADKAYYAAMDAQMEEWDKDMEAASSKEHNADASTKSHNADGDAKSPNAETEAEQTEVEYVNPVNVEFDPSELV